MQFCGRTPTHSISKSCAMILDVAGLSDLFDARVDGVDSEILGIPGKPAPDIFLEAARQLRVEPARAVVIEDAVSGVQAGQSGKFGLVIGISRAAEKKPLRKTAPIPWWRTCRKSALSARKILRRLVGGDHTGVYLHLRAITHSKSLSGKL